MSKAIGNKASLENFLATIPSPTREPGEFTLPEIHAALVARGDTRNFSGVSAWIERKRVAGEYTKRSVVLNGRRVSVFKLNQSKPQR